MRDGCSGERTEGVGERRGGEIAVVLEKEEEEKEEE